MAKKKKTPRACPQCGKTLYKNWAEYFRGHKELEGYFSSPYSFYTWASYRGFTPETPIEKVMRARRVYVRKKRWN